MKTKFSPALIAGITFIIILPAIIFSCEKNVSGDQKIESDNPTPESIIAQAGKATVPYNLNVIMYGKSGLGFVKFRQNADTARIINLDTWVFNLKPNHAYLLQRAVDPFSDTTSCSSTTWLTLGLGLTPRAIHTNRFGFGAAPLWRDVTAIPRGAEFYIHFQVIDSLTSKVVLTSGCNTYAVR
jgi:hypothetical protein